MLATRGPLSKTKQALNSMLNASREPHASARRLDGLGWRFVRLSTRLECLIHFFEASLRVPIEAGPEHRDQNASELLALRKPYFSVVNGLDSEAMLAIEEAGDQESTQPTKLVISGGGNNSWPERHALGAARLDPNDEPGA